MTYMTKKTAEARADAKAAPSNVDQAFEEKVERLRALFATAPEMGRKALEDQIQALASARAREPESRMESAGRIGTRQGKVSELLVIAPFAPGGAERLRAVLDLRNGDFSDTDRVGTVHDMRFVFIENDTKLLFATAYDGDWDPYIEDFAAKIPAQMDVLFTAFEGWPGINSGQAVKDWIAAHQIPADGWYVAHPGLTVRDIRRLKHVGAALDEFLDKVGSQ